MKRTQLVGARVFRMIALGVLALLVMCPDGFGYYQAEKGRWMSRDPIEEVGGENLYAFVLNDPMSLVDPFGLKWAVIRNYDSRADANCDCDDTVDDLAAEIKLDPKEFTKWLIAADGKGLPSSRRQKMKKARKFTIPNEAHITQGNLERNFGFDVHSKTARRKEDYVRKYKKQKYAVKDHFTDNIAGNNVSDINEALGSKDVYVWAHFGHGLNPSGSLAIGYPFKAHGPDSFKGHHKLSVVLLYSCYAGLNANGWMSFVAQGGSLFASRTAVNPSFGSFPPPEIKNKGDTQ